MIALVWIWLAVFMFVMIGVVAVCLCEDVDAPPPFLFGLASACCFLLAFVGLFAGLNAAKLLGGVCP